MAKTGLVVSAHPGDFVWRAGGAIALHAKRDYRVKIVCLAFGERGESQFAWKQPGMTLDTHQPEMCNFKPQVILNIDEVWDVKRKTFEILAAQKHLWAYYERVALQRGMQGGRNSGKAMTYGEAYQRLFPMALEELV